MAVDLVGKKALLEFAKEQSDYPFVRIYHGNKGGSPTVEIKSTAHNEMLKKLERALDILCPKGDVNTNEYRAVFTQDQDGGKSQSIRFQLSKFAKDEEEVVNGKDGNIHIHHRQPVSGISAEDAKRMVDEAVEKVKLQHQIQSLTDLMQQQSNDHAEQIRALSRKIEEKALISSPDDEDDEDDEEEEFDLYDTAIKLGRVFKMFNGKEDRIGKGDRKKKPIKKKGKMADKHLLEQNKKIQKAVNLLFEHDEELGDHLLFLANMAETKPKRFQNLLAMLEDEREEMEDEEEDEDEDDSEDDKPQSRKNGRNDEEDEDEDDEGADEEEDEEEDFVDFDSRA